MASVFPCPMSSQRRGQPQGWASGPSCRLCSWWASICEGLWEGPTRWRAQAQEESLWEVTGKKLQLFLLPGLPGLRPQSALLLNPNLSFSKLGLPTSKPLFLHSRPFWLRCLRSTGALVCTEHWQAWSTVRDFRQSLIWSSVCDRLSPFYLAGYLPRPHTVLRTDPARISTFPVSLPSTLILEHSFS